MSNEWSINRSFFNDGQKISLMSNDMNHDKNYKKIESESTPEAVVESTSEAVVESTPEPTIIEDTTSSTDSDRIDYLVTVSESETEYRSRKSFEEFTDERMLVSYDAFGNKQMKIKVLEVSDENPPSKWKFGDRVKVSKILVTIKHLATQEVEEGEFDIESIERELAEKRHYTSTNRWIPANDIKNGYVVGSRHTTLISDASALDYIIF